MDQENRWKKIWVGGASALALLLLVGLALAFIASLRDPQSLVVPPEQTACTLDAMICPDGSAVGRVPPSCEFAACPGVLAPESPERGEQNRPGYFVVAQAVPQRDITGKVIAQSVRKDLLLPLPDSARSTSDGILLSGVLYVLTPLSENRSAQTYPTNTTIEDILVDGYYHPGFSVERKDQRPLLSAEMQQWRELFRAVEAQ